MLQSCETKPYLKRCTVCFGYRGEIQWPSEMTQPLSAASPQTSAGLFVSGLSFVLLRILSFFSALAVQITIPKYKEIPGQFYPLLQWAKHINKTYMYLNLLLIISAADKKITTKKVHILHVKFSCLLY